MWSYSDHSVKSEDCSRIGKRLKPDTGLEWDIAAQELTEVCKLQELVRRLEIQNEALSTRRRNIKSNNHVLISCSSLPEERPNFFDLPDPEPVKFNNEERISPPSCESPVDILVEQDGHLFDVCYTNLPQSDMLKETNGHGCMMSGKQIDVDTERRADMSVLDLVDLLDLDECCVGKDDVSWLYETAKKQTSVERSNDSPIKWCRQVLDNPSPETEVACRKLVNVLDQSKMHMFKSHSHRDPAAFPDNINLCMGSPLYQRSANRSKESNKPHSLGSVDDDDSLPSSRKENKLNIPDRLQHITDTWVVADMKEKSLQQEYVSIPATVTTFRSPDTSLLSPSNYSYSNLEFDMYSLDRVVNKPRASQLHHFQRSPFGQSHRSIAQPRYSSQLPRPSSHATTQAHLLKLARSREELRLSMQNLNSPPRTSLRSLQAVRNSRYLEANGQLPTDHPNFHLSNPIADSTCSPPGASPVRLGSGGRYSSVSAQTKETAPVGAWPSLRMSFQETYIRRQLSAQSLSTSGLRMPRPSKDYLSNHVYASSGRSNNPAWSRLGQIGNARR